MSTPPRLNLEQFLQAHPNLYSKLCFWAGNRNVPQPAQQVQEYLTELVVEANELVQTCAQGIVEQDHLMLLQKWSKVLSLQERSALTYLTPIEIGSYPDAHQWYDLQKGAYSVANEPVLHEISHDGQQQGIVTRNRYGCLVLNCDRLLIVDVDLGAPQPSDRDCAASCQIALSQRQAIAALAVLVEQFPQLGFRVYRTRNGLRHLCTTQEFDPLDDYTQRLMQNLYADPLYARLCRFQATFRARLTPKPWRVKKGTAGQFVYDRTTGLVLPENNPYAVCHLIEVIGEQKILPKFEPLIQLHDSYCRVGRLGLELA